MRLLSRVQLFVTPWTVAYQTPQSMKFSRQEYWSGLPFPFPGDLPDPGINPRSPKLQADALPSEAPEKLSEGREIEREGESLVSQCQGTGNTQCCRGRWGWALQAKLRKLLGLEQGTDKNRPVSP